MNKLRCVIIGSIHQGIYNSFREAAFVVAPLVFDSDKKFVAARLEAGNMAMNKSGATFRLNNDIQFLMLEVK